ncbi:MAG TPA: hypothetical protein DD738_06855 [Ruminiclostridium sp.]|nr:hypothetical protein [Ruminiclostridium sp.]
MDAYNMGLVMGGGIGGLMLATYLWAAIYFGHIRGEEGRERVFAKVLFILAVIFFVFAGIFMAIDF